jgi:hypothetical protein
VYLPDVGAAISNEPFASVTPVTEFSSFFKVIETPLRGLPEGSEIFPEIPGPSKAETFALLNIEKKIVRKKV